MFDMVDDVGVFVTTRKSYYKVFISRKATKPQRAELQQFKMNGVFS